MYLHRQVRILRYNQFWSNLSLSFPRRAFNYYCESSNTSLLVYFLPLESRFCLTLWESNVHVPKTKSCFVWYCLMLLSICDYIYFLSNSKSTSPNDRAVHDVRSKLTPIHSHSDVTYPSNANEVNRSMQVCGALRWRCAILLCCEITLLRVKG